MERCKSQWQERSSTYTFVFATAKETSVCAVVKAHEKVKA
jgi:hypothetical protein